MNDLCKIAEDAKKHIKENIGTGVSPEETAKAMNYSLRQLSRLFSLSTGLTLGEYIRWSKLAKAFFEVKDNDAPLIDIALKYGYESQEGFTRAFKDNFSVTPGDYRKTKQSITAKNWHVNEFIHKEAHNASVGGAFTRGHVDSWIVTKPERLWVSFRKNVENVPPYTFFDICAKEGVMQKSNAFPGADLAYGAYFPPKQNSLLSFGVELEADYSGDIPGEYEVTRIPQSKYVVFNYPKYSMDKHGDAIRSTWGAQQDFDINAHGLRWSFDSVPVFEADEEELGYILWFPVCDVTKADANTPAKTYYAFSDLQASFRSNTGCARYNVAENGALHVEFDRQYEEVTYVFPQCISLNDYQSVTVNGMSADGDTAVKFFGADGQQAFVMWNNRSQDGTDWIHALTAEEKCHIIKSIGIMSQGEGKQSAKIYSITWGKEPYNGL